MKLTKSLTTIILGCIASFGLAHAEPLADLKKGYTAVTPDPGFLTAATSLGVEVAPTKGRSLRFPIASGSLDLETAAGEILQSGGISLTAGETVVELTSFIIDTTDSPVLTGLVVVNEEIVARLPLFEIILPAGLTLPLEPTGRYAGRLDLRGFGLTLTGEAAGALNDVFEVTAFTDGFAIGTARIRTVVPPTKPRRSGFGSFFSYFRR